MVKKIFFLLSIISGSFCSFSQPEMERLEWKPFFDQYKGGGGMEFKGRIYDTHTIGISERISVYDAQTKLPIRDTNLHHIVLEDFKKPKHMEHYGYFQEDGEAYLLAKCSAKKGLNNIYIIPLTGDDQILNSEEAELSDEGLELDVIYNNHGYEVRNEKYIALREAKYMGNDEYSGLETTLLVLDVINDKLVRQFHVEKGIEYSDFWDGRFFISGDFAAFSYQGNMKVSDLDYGDDAEVNLKTHIKSSNTPRLIAFQKTMIGLVAVVNESPKSDDYQGSDEVTGTIHRLVFNEDLELQSDKTISWNLKDENIGRNEPTHEVYISMTGDVFIMSNEGRLYGMDIFGISSGGEKWVKSIPFNHGSALIYKAHNTDGTGIQLQVHQNHLYIAYADNLENTRKVDYNNYQRPAKQSDLVHFDEEEGRVITILRIDGSGKVELFKVFDESLSVVNLTNMDIEDGFIHLHGNHLLKRKTAIVPF